MSTAESSESTESSESAESAVPVAVYWRPGCPWCTLLRGGLRRAGILTVEYNIWEDDEAAATVRAVAGGNETVPTVFVGEVALVNPSVAEVRRAMDSTPGAPAHDAPASSSTARSRLRRALRRLGGVGRGG